MAAFYPSCVLNFKMTFDEQLTIAQDVNPSSLLGSKDAPTVGKSSTGIPLILLGSNPDGTGLASWVYQRVPKSMNMEKPGYRQAQQFSCTLDFRDIPIDPRTVRSVAVEIHLGTVSESDFAAGFKGKDANGRYRSILQTRDDSGAPNQSTLRMIGIADDWNVTHSGSGSEVSLTGRDIRGTLLDTPIGPAGVSDKQLLDSIDWGKPINEVVAQILAFNVFFHVIQVICNAQDWPGGVIPSPGLHKGGVLRHRQGARGTKEAADGKPQGATSGLNFWDLIVRACYLCGAIPYITGAGVAIRPSATVFDKLRGPIDPAKNPTPFLAGQPRTKDAITNSVINPGLRARRLVYGRDTESVSINRKFAGWRKPKIIRTISVDLDAETSETQLQYGLWPPQKGDTLKLKKSKVTHVSPSGMAASDILTIPVPGVKDPERLTVIAHAIYEELGRGEIGGEVETPNLASFGGDNADPDLLHLDPGDGIEFFVDTRSLRQGAAPLISSFTDANRRSFDDQVKEILTKIPDFNLARVIVATARGQIAELQNFFRVQTVKTNWDADSGVKLNFDFQNYVVARAQVEDASANPGSATSVSPGTSSAKSKAPGSLGNL